MKKEKCAICGQKKGKRVCVLRGQRMICSLCCAELRNPDCGGCTHYAAAQSYAGRKTARPQSEHFIAEINLEVEEAVGHALALLEQGRIKEGEAIISGLKEDHPGNHMVYYGIGVVHALRGEHDEAIGYFDKAVSIFPYFIEAHFNKAVAYKKKLDIINTIKAFRRVVKLGESGDDLVRQAQSFIGDMAQHIHKTDGIDLDSYIKCGERFNEAFSCMEKREWKEAIAGFQACLSKNKRHVQSYGNMGICYAQLGQKERARETLDKAIELDPTYEPALTNRVIIESLKEGEELEMGFETIEYYTDKFRDKKSSIK